jgi:hypothetical protein
MKRMIITSLLLCALGASNIWAMEQEEPERRSVEITVCSTAKDHKEKWEIPLNFKCYIGMNASEQENIDEKLQKYFFEMLNYQILYLKNQIQINLNSGFQQKIIGVCLLSKIMAYRN